MVVDWGEDATMLRLAPIALFLVTLIGGCHLFLPLSAGEAGVSPDSSSDGPGADAALLDAPPDLPGDTCADLPRDVWPDLPDNDSGVVPGTWVTIPAGSFTMGSPPPEPCREQLANGYKKETLHEVKLTHSFEIQTTEVTRGQFQGVMSYDPSVLKTCGLSCPVETVSWHEMAAYCNALSTQMGYGACYQCSGSGASVTCSEASLYSGAGVYTCPGYRLPTEAEWEHAYRAGTTTAYYNGPNNPALCSECSPLDANLNKIGWYCGNSNYTIHPVGQKNANTWKLHDMAGNVWEWCHDWGTDDLGSSLVTDPFGSATGTHRVIRGGAGSVKSPAARAAARYFYKPDSTVQNLGGRCCRTK